MRRLALAIVVATTAVARADVAGDLRAAEERAARGEPGAIDALEAVGRIEPASEWTDNAWREAARLAEKAGDFQRARDDFGKAIAADTDSVQRTRDEHDLARLTAQTGGGAWDAVAAAHERIATAIQAPGDPVDSIAELELLVHANPRYPRRGDARLAAARGWDRIGYLEREAAILDEALADPPTALDRVHARVAMTRVRIGQGDLAAARDQVLLLTSEGGDPVLLRELDREIDRAELRQRLRWLAWGVLVAIAAAAVAVLRRDAGAWTTAVRRLVRPPFELAYFAPVAAILVIMAATGNPLVSASVWRIAVAGAAIAWVSGALLDGAARVRGRRAVLHAGLAVVAMAAATYLSVDRGRMLDLIVETWRGGVQR